MEERSNYGLDQRSDWEFKEGILAANPSEPPGKRVHPIGKTIISKGAPPRGEGLKNPPTPPNRDLSVFS